MRESTGKNRVFGKIAMVAVLGLVSVLGAQGVGYLAKIGPGPLRFQAPHAANPTMNLPPLPKADRGVSDVAGTESIVVKPSENITYRAGFPSAAASLPARFFTPWALWPNLAPDADSLLPEVTAPPADSTPAPSAAGDLLTITPQMLVDYFRPQGSTNGAGVAVQVPVSFTPATPAAPDSGATYESP
jgi:hypothetical protein